MAPSLWQLSITHLGETQPTQQIARSVVVEADSWLSALREARRQLGEEGGVPPGASCVMAPNGGVTIDDPGRQLRYVLTLVSGQAGRAARDVQGDPESGSAAAPSLPPPAHEAQGLPPTGSPTTPRSPLPPKPFSRALQTLPYSAERAAALQRDFEAARRIQAAITPPEPLSRPNLRAVAPDALRPSTPPPAGTGTGASAAESEAPAADASPSAPIEELREELRSARAESGGSRATGATAPSAPGADATHTSARGARTRVSDVTGTGPTSVEAANTNTASASSTRPAATGSDDQTRLPVLSSRDVEPGPSSPLTYRERAFLLPSGGSTTLVEQRLFDELALIQRALADRPHGKYVNLAVFDEPFEGIPMHPPRATLEWMDWRGEPVFTLIADAAASALANTNAQPSDPAPTRARTKHDTGEPDQRLAAAFEAMPELHTLTTPVAAFEFSVSLIERLVPAEAVSVCLYDIDTHEYRFVTLTGSGATERKASAIPASVGLFGEATQQARPLVVVSDASRAPRFDPAIDGRLGLEAREIVYLPLRRQHHPLGMLQLINRRAPDGRFQDSDLAVLHYIAAQLTEFLVTRRSLSH